jgi:molecular chaperone DnaK
VCRSRRPSEIFWEFLCEDASGTSVEVDYELTPEDVQEVSLPHIESTLELCRKTLSEVDLDSGDMARILMVGGSTLNPWVREAVAAEINQHVEFGIDPVTVVARGAAIFASIQEHPWMPDEPVAPGTWTVDAVHKPVGNVPDPDFGGRVAGPAGERPDGYTIELIDARTRWSTGRIKLGSDGAFMTQLHAERKRKHEFILELCDPTGTRVPVTPSSVSYIMGVVPESNPPVARTIGIGVHDGSVKPYFPKGTRLPARKTHLHRSAVPVKAGDPEDELRIPLVEGEHRRVERNYTIGWMIIRGSDVRADLLIGSDVEITITMDESQMLKMQAHIPFLEQDFWMPFESRLGRRSMANLLEQLAEEKKRLAKIRRTASETGSVAAEDVIAGIVQQRLLEQVEELAKKAGGDPEAELELDRTLSDVAAALDRAEDLVELPELIQAASEELESTRKVVEAYGGLEHRHQLEQIEELLERAARTQDAELIRLRTTQLASLRYQVLDGEDGFHLGRFEWLADRVDTMRDPTQANRLVTQGRRAIQNDDIDAVKATNRQLTSLLPRDRKTVGGLPIGIV